MKKLATLLIGILLSINTFSQEYLLEEIVIVDIENQKMIDLIEAEHSIIKSVNVSFNKRVATLQMINSSNEITTEEVVKIEKDAIEEDGRVVYGKNKEDKHIVITFAKNGYLLVEYRKSYELKDTETSMFFVTK